MSYSIAILQAVTSVGGRALAFSRLLCVIAWACVLVGPNGEAQKRQAIVQSLDLDVPMAPATVTIDGTVSLVYELHITNLLRHAVTLNRIQVVNATAGAPILADYEDAELQRRIGRPGLPREIGSPRTIGPGLRLIVYLWIPLSGRADAPVTVAHRVEARIDQPDPTNLSFTGGDALVSTEPPVVLDAPLRGGPWVAIYDPLLIGGHRTAIYTLNGRARIPGRFAIDWIKLRHEGVLDRGKPPARDWNGYGAEVLAVADGIVAAAMDDMADNDWQAGSTVHSLENASGNYLALDIGGGRFAFYEHLQHRSLTVGPGDRVRRGQVVARLGNSGSSSIGPHLHFHVSDANSPLSAEGRPFVFRRFEHLGAFASIDAMIAGATWRAEPETTRTLERPRANAVLRFQ